MFSAQLYFHMHGKVTPLIYICVCVIMQGPSPTPSQIERWTAEALADIPDSDWAADVQSHRTAGQPGTSRPIKREQVGLMC